MLAMLLAMGQTALSFEDMPALPAEEFLTTPPRACPLCGEKFISGVWLAEKTGLRTWACSDLDCENAFGVSLDDDEGAAQ